MSHKKRRTSRSKGKAAGEYAAPSKQQFSKDPLVELSKKHWGGKSRKPKTFDTEVVEKIYVEHLEGGKGNEGRLMVLELSQYLERYLWPHFNAKRSTRNHLLSILFMVNEKRREDVPVWTAFHSDEEKFKQFFTRALCLSQNEDLTIAEKTQYILFFITCFQSFEDNVVREQVLGLVQLPLWHALPEGRRNIELGRLDKKLQRHWKRIVKDKKKRKRQPYNPKSEFIPSLLADYLDILASIDCTKDEDADKITYCERFVELLIDLISQLPTRRFLRPVIQHSHVLIKSRMSPLMTSKMGLLYSRLVGMLRFYDGFEIDDYSGVSLSDMEMQKRHYSKI